MQIAYASATHRHRTGFIQHNKIVVNVNYFDWMFQNWCLMPVFGFVFTICVFLTDSDFQEQNNVVVVVIVFDFFFFCKKMF